MYLSIVCTQQAHLPEVQAQCIQLRVCHNGTVYAPSKVPLPVGNLDPHLTQSSFVQHESCLSPSRITHLPNTEAHYVIFVSVGCIDAPYACKPIPMAVLQLKLNLPVVFEFIPPIVLEEILWR